MTQPFFHELDFKDLGVRRLVAMEMGRLMQLKLLRLALGWRAVPVAWPFLRLQVRPKWTHRTERLHMALYPPYAVPFGWIVVHDPDTETRIIGPWWAMLDHLYRIAERAVYRSAIRIGAARQPYDGCYYHEVEWWPRNPN